MVLKLKAVYNITFVYLLIKSVLRKVVLTYAGAQTHNNTGTKDDGI